MNNNNVLDEATENGIATMSKDIAEMLEIRIRNIITAAVKAGATPQDQPTAVRIVGFMLDELMQEAACLTTTGLESHFSGFAPYAEASMGVYAESL